MTDEYDPTDRADIREAEKLAKVQEKQDLGVVRDIMRTTAGRAWMFRKLAACHVYQTTFSANALNSAFMEGERNVGLMLNSEVLLASTDDFILMLRENNERDATIDAARRNRKRDNGADDTNRNFVDYSNVDDTGGAEGRAEVGTEH